MVLSELLQWAVGSTAGQIGIAVGLIAVALYWRKLTMAGSTMQSWGGRVAFSAVAVGVLLLLGVISGVDVERATGIAATAGEWLLEAATEIWEVFRSWR
ncbi:hypothetical protein [Natronomonas marina]|uniref:hypothetical protein n=1 Tax=Natronomonas marina TaxID=2961939 RepID=UPI0020CA0C59|nr:hypothetical protein [Natronomonas marina]